MKKEEQIPKMKKVIEAQKRVIEMLSNDEAVVGLNKAIEDVKKGNYIVLTN